MEETIDKIREAIKDRKVHIVAQNLNISPVTIYRLLSTRDRKRGPNPSTVKMLADYLGVK